MFTSDYECWRLKLAGLLGRERYRHSLRVSALAGELAGFWQLDKEKALTAGLLHDLAREMPLSELLALADLKLGAAASDLKKVPILLHAPLAALILREDWGIKDEEILDAVAGHTLAGPAMRPLTQVVFLADMLDPVRTWDGIEEIRAMAYRDLDQALLLALKYQLAWLQKQKKYIHPAIYDAYAYYQALVKGKNREEV